jgi:hypothetical protein
MKNKFFTTLIVACAMTFNALTAQVIPSTMFGENAWMPDTIGTMYYNGFLHKNWNLIEQSNVSLFRIGGIQYDVDGTTPYQYLKLVDSIRAHGMEPIVQIGYANGAFDTTAASNLVQYLNVTKGRNVKYWAVGNEPKSTYATDTTAGKIAKYLQTYSRVMKQVDTSIKIIGPSLNRINGDDPFDPAQKLFDTLTNPSYSSSLNITGVIPFGAAAGKAYVDILSYHMYNYNGNGTAKTRAWVTGRVTGTDTADMGWTKRRCNLINSTVTGRAGYPIKPMITEANLTYQGPTAPSDDNFAGTKASSFICGQQWCEMLSYGINKGIESINFWSSMRFCRPAKEEYVLSHTANGEVL